MRTKMIMILAVGTLLLSSCASDDQHTAVKENDTVSSDDTMVERTATREPVFVYNQPKKVPDRIVLSFSSGPILLPSGYVRLAGVVSGGDPIACLEIGGRGLAFLRGEKADDYRVERINGDSVILEK